MSKCLNFARQINYPNKILVLSQTFKLAPCTYARVDMHMYDDNDMMVFRSLYEIIIGSDFEATRECLGNVISQLTALRGEYNPETCYDYYYKQPLLKLI